MNWNYGSLPPCSTYESEHQVPFPYVGANCNAKASLAQVRGDDPYPKPPGGFAWDSWNPDSLPSCHHWRNAHEIPYPYVGANCVNRNGKEALAQVRGDEDPKMPPWDSWNPSTLPRCSDWRNAHEVPYPMVGANCVTTHHEELAKDALVQEPWNEEDLGSCKERRPAHVVAYPHNGANCRDTMSSVNGEKLDKSNSLVQKCEPWDVDSLGSCSDRRPAHVVEYPNVGANCDPKKPQSEVIIPALAQI